MGPLILRVFVGSVLVYGTQDNVFHTARMLEFRDFLTANGFPQPLLSAYVSAWAQFTSLPFTANIAPLSMLFGNIFLLLYGPGIVALEQRVGQSRK